MLLNSTPISTNIYFTYWINSGWGHTLTHSQLSLKLNDEDEALYRIVEIVSIKAPTQSLKKETVESITYHYYAPQNTPTSAII